NCSSVGSPPLVLPLGWIEWLLTVVRDRPSSSQVSVVFLTWSHSFSFGSPFFASSISRVWRVRTVPSALVSSLPFLLTPLLLSVQVRRSTPSGPRVASPPLRALPFFSDHFSLKVPLFRFARKVRSQDGSPDLYRDNSIWLSLPSLAVPRIPDLSGS